MENDQRILDIISAAIDKRPADVEPLATDIIGERVAALVSARKSELSSQFYGEPVVEEEVAPEVYSDEEVQPAATEEDDDQDA